MPFLPGGTHKTEPDVYNYIANLGIVNGFLRNCKQILQKSKITGEQPGKSRKTRGKRWGKWELCIRCSKEKTGINLPKTQETM